MHTHYENGLRGTGKMVIKFYKGVGKGETLYKAIMDTAYGASDPPLVRDYIDELTKNYLSEEYDSSFIEDIIDKYSNSRFILACEIIKEHDVDVDDIWYSNITRTDFLNWSKDYPEDSEKHKICLDINKELIDSTEGSGKIYDKRWEKAYELACDDFNNSLYHIDTGCDEEIANIFGIELCIEGYEYDGQEYDLSEIFLCPNCGEAMPIDKQQESYEYYSHDDEPYSTSKFYCDNCGCEESIIDTSFREKNPHIPDDIIISRCV